jgi:prepilin peptidase CpaA
MSHSTVLTLYSAGLLWAIAGAICDITSSRVPNFLTVPAMSCALMLHMVFGGWVELRSSLLGGLIGGAIFFIFYLAGGMGAGDVKLIAALGCFTGLPNIGHLLVSTALVGGVIAVAVTIYRHSFRQTISNLGSLILHHRAFGLTPHPAINVGNAQNFRLPYALPIFVGYALTFSLVVAQG